MRNLTKKLILLSIYLISLALPLRAAFVDYGFGSRGAGKGGAFIVSADDASAAEWNPAALMNVSGLDMMFEYNKFFAGLSNVDLNHTFASAAYDFSNTMSAGFSYAGFKGDNLYSSDVFRFTFAGELKVSGINVANGLSLKYLAHSYDFDSGEEADSVDSLADKGAAGEAVTADFGIVVEPAANVHMGISAKNLIPADIGIDKEDIVPLEIGAGAGYRILRKDWYFSEIIPEAFISYRHQQWGKDSYKINIGLGTEMWTSDRRIGVRTGINKYEAALGGSFAFGVASNTMRIDYTALLPFSELSDHFGHHRIALSYNFPISSEKEFPEEKKKELMKKYFMRGHELFAAGRYGESVKKFRKVLELDPTHVESQNYIERAEKEKLKKSYFMQAHELFADGHYRESIEKFKKVLKLDPTHIQSQNYIKRAENHLK